VVGALVKGEAILWMGFVDYERVRLATAVVTPSCLLVNSADVPEDVNHTELDMRFARQAVAGAEHQPRGKLRYLSFFIWGTFAHTVWLRLADGRSKRFMFREKHEALEFCAAINDWVESN
jgi:hypothetical protein